MTAAEFASQFFQDTGAKAKPTNWTRLRDAVAERDAESDQLRALVDRLPANGPIDDALWADLTRFIARTRSGHPGSMAAVQGTAPAKETDR